MPLSCNPLRIESTVGFLLGSPSVKKIMTLLTGSVGLSLNNLIAPHCLCRSGGS